MTPCCSPRLRVVGFDCRDGSQELCRVAAAIGPSGKDAQAFEVEKGVAREEGVNGGEWGWGSAKDRHAVRTSKLDSLGRQR